MTRKPTAGSIFGALALSALFAAAPAQAFELGIIAFQMSSETHARVANTAAAEAKKLGWTVTLLNSEGSLPKHTEEFETLINKKVDAILIAMGKPVEAAAQFELAREKGIPVITVMSGASKTALMDVQDNEYKVGAEAAVYLMGQMGYQGNLLMERFEGNVATRIRGKAMDVVLSENKGVKLIGSHSMNATGGWRDEVRSGMQALLLRNQGQINGIWVSFDAQGYIVDDLLQAQGVKKGQIPIVSVDGGKETYRRIADPESLITATFAIPFEGMGKAAVNALDTIVVKKQPKETVTIGPYLFMDATLVDANNVKSFLQP